MESLQNALTSCALRSNTSRRFAAVPQELEIWQRVKQGLLDQVSISRLPPYVEHLSPQFPSFAGPIRNLIPIRTEDRRCHFIELRPRLIINHNQPFAATGCGIRHYLYRNLPISYDLPTYFCQITSAVNISHATFPVPIIKQIAVSHLGTWAEIDEVLRHSTSSQNVNRLWTYSFEPGRPGKPYPILMPILSRNLVGLSPPMRTKT